MRLDVRKQETIKQGDTFLGNRTRVKVVKNKLAAPFKFADFDIMYGEGISKSGDILDCAVDAKIVDKAGSWYSYQGERMGQGRENVKIYFESHPKILDELYEKVMDTLKPDDNDDSSESISSKAEKKDAKNTGPNLVELEVDEDGVVIE